MDNTVTIVHRYMFVSCCYPVHLTTEPVYENEFRILQAKPVMCLLVSIVVCKQNIGKEHRVGRESNADKVLDSETTLLVSMKGDKNDLVDSEKTP